MSSCQPFVERVTPSGGKRSPAWLGPWRTAGLILALVASACGSHPIPPPQPAPKPQACLAPHFSPAAVYAVSVDGVIKFTDANGYVYLGPWDAGTSHQLINGPVGFIPYSELKTATSLNCDYTVAMTRAPLPAVTISGNRFFAGGRDWAYWGQTFFQAYQAHLNGTLTDATIADVFDQANVGRVFLNWGNVGFNPSDYGDRFFSELPVFAKRIAAAGGYVEFVLFAPKPLSPEFENNVGAQIAFAQRVYAALANETNVLYEKANEPVQDGFDVSPIPDPPAGFVWSSGVYDGRGPVGLYLTFHGRRDFKSPLDYFPVECRHDGLPCVNDEGPKPGDVDTDPQFWWEMGSGARGGNGGTFHCLSCEAAQPLNATERADRDAFFAGLAGRARP